MTLNKQAAVGAFVLGGIAIMILTVILFGKFHLFNSPRHFVIVFSDSVSGLAIGSPVTFRGLRVGAVDHVEIQYDSRTTKVVIPVIVELETKLMQITGDGSQVLTTESLIKLGLRAELKTQSFVTGTSEIDLDFYPGSIAPAHAGVSKLPEIPTHDSAIHQLADELSNLPVAELVKNIQSTLASMRGVAEKLDSSLPPLLASFQVTSERATRAIEIAARSMKDVHSKVESTLGHIDRLAMNGDQQLTARGAELQTLLVSANDTVLHARVVLTDVQSVTSDRSAARTNIESALRDLAATTDSLRGFASDIEHDPQLLLKGRRH